MMETGLAVFLDTQIASGPKKAPRPRRSHLDMAASGFLKGGKALLEAPDHLEDVREQRRQEARSHPETARRS